MKIVLLAAGRSFRMAPIADKNFLNFLGKPLILHQVDALKKAGFREILMIGGKHNLKKLAMFRKAQHDKKITVREQKDLELGMAGAILTAKTWIGKDPFLLVSGNDVVEPSVFSVIAREAAVVGRPKQSGAKAPSRASGDGSRFGFLLAKKVLQYFPGGYLKVNSRGVISKIVEKPKPGREPSKLVNLVVHYHPQPKALFSVIASECKRAKQSPDDCYEQALQILFDQGISYRALPYNGFWQPVKYPWHVLALMNFYLENLAKMHPRGRIGGKKAEVAKTAVINGDVYLEDGVRVLDNAVIQGPAYIGRNTVVATNALVRGSHIGENCVIGFGSEVARSYVGDNVWTHTNYIGDSIIGNNVSFGAGTVTGNLRLDEKSVKVTVTKRWNGKTEEERVDSGTTKLGLITGDNIRVGINTSFMPGVKVGSNSFVGAGIVVAEDVPESSFVRGDWKLKITKNSERINPRGGLR